ncbi:TIGR02569 family protein [uncultured Corynebacterium sp.]|uniref:TIGR02569 family protein n=1 Tax=uncultured Corynebacterium sp. TaxID=159447 RepID=UPI00259AA8D1|nr:TIGR02569 family protein [uncultured Corynebacterium sp.]
MSTQPPSHILTSFQVPAAKPVQLDAVWSEGWRCDRAVISRSDEPARAAWIARTTAKIRPAGVSVSRPIVSSDGRFSVSGWRARTFLSGHRAPRFDEMATAALRIGEALRGEARPAVLDSPPLSGQWDENEIFAAAEEAAFAEDPTVWLTTVLDADSVPRADVAQALAKAAELTELRGEISEPSQLVHADVLGCVIFDGSADPILTDLVPAWRPAGWPVALLIVDAMAWANGPNALIERWSHLPDFRELVVRAALYRVVLHVLLPNSRPEAWRGLARVADVVAASQRARQA